MQSTYTYNNISQTHKKRRFFFVCFHGVQINFIPFDSKIASLSAFRVLCVCAICLCMQTQTHVLERICLFVVVIWCMCVDKPGFFLECKQINQTSDLMVEFTRLSTQKCSGKVHEQFPVYTTVDRIVTAFTK